MRMQTGVFIVSALAVVGWTVYAQSHFVATWIFMLVLLTMVFLGATLYVWDGGRR